jgi:hypothetical protein
MERAAYGALALLTAALAALFVATVALQDLGLTREIIRHTALSAAAFLAVSVVIVSLCNGK